MNINNTRIQILDKPRELGKDGTNGVSLHCHTLYSKEMLDFIPFYAAKIPIVKHIWKRECRRYTEREGNPPNFNTGYWEPPLTGRQVFTMEREQMNKAGLGAIVSITDHDSIEANIEINTEIDNIIAPVSMEWTVPFGCAYFHLGVHNIPPDRAIEIKQHLLDYTFAGGEPDNERLHEIFALLNGMSEVLVVLNHPVWDIEMIGQERHNVLLDAFVAEHSHWLHAIEINGFRPWSENREAMSIAQGLNLPMISGGDRHCLRSNTMINVTDADSFDEFAAEIRVDKHSHVIVFPEYQKPLALRQIESMAAIMGDYPYFPVGRQRWYERVYFDADDTTGVRTLASHWNGKEPAWHRWAIMMLSISSHRRLLPIFRLLEGSEDKVPKEARHCPVFIGGKTDGARIASRAGSRL